MTVPNSAPVPGVDGLVARLILDPNDLEQLTNVRVTDARSALTRGLADYLSQLSIQVEGGRFLSFKNVTSSWADYENEADFPAASIVTAESGTYDSAVFAPSPIVVPSRAVGGVSFYLEQTAELVMPMSIVVWATDDLQREAMVVMLEDALDPAENWTGLRLELPYYFNSRATYEKLEVVYEDSAQSATQRWQRALLRLTGIVPQYRIGRLPPRERFRLVLETDE